MKFLDKYVSTGILLKMQNSSDAAQDLLNQNLQFNKFTTDSQCFFHWRKIKEGVNNKFSRGIAMR